MSKVKVLIIAVIIILLGVGGFFGYRYFTKTIISVNHPFDAIPDNNAFIIEASSLDNLLNEVLADSSFISNLYLRNSSDSSANIWDLLNKEIESSQSLLATFHSSHIYISSHFMGLDKFQYLISVGIIQHFDVADLTKFLQGKGSLTMHDFEGFDLYSFKMSQTNQTVYFTYNKGMLSVSLHRPLIEKVLFTLKSDKSISGEPIVARLIKMSGDTPLNLYVNYKYFYRFLSQYATDYRDDVKQLGLLAERSELDVQLLDNYLLMTGYSIYSDSMDAYFQRLRGMKPQKMSSLKIVPYNTMFLSYTGVDNYTDFYNNSIDFFNPKLVAKRQKMEKKYDFSVQKNILSWVNKEVTFCITGCDWKNSSDHSYIIVAVTDIKEANQQLVKIAEHVSEVNNLSSDTVSYRAYKIHKIGIPFFIPNIFGETFDNLSSAIYTTIGNNVVFANSSAAIKQFIDSYLVGKTLAEESSFKDFSENLSDKSNLFLYFNMKYYNRYFSHFLNAEVLNKDFDGILPKVGELAIELSAGENGTYTSVVMSLGNEQNSEVDEPVSWQEALDAPAFGRPYLIVNHVSNTREVLIFDNQNSLYRIDKEGNTAWKIPLLESPMSDIFMVDFYKNGKYQYVFNTANYIYIVDLNGNRVDDYPFKLPATATGKMSLMDYDRTKNYRILIPLDDGKLHNFKLDRSPTPGWVEASFSKEYITPVEHFRLRNKDFLLFADTLGNVVFANRRGEARMEAKLAFTNNYKTGFYKTGKGSMARITTTDLMGRVVEIDGAGNVEKLTFDDFSVNHLFQICDFDLDGNTDFIYYDRNRLKVFSAAKEKLLDTVFIDKQIDYIIPIKQITNDSIRLILHDANSNALVFIMSSGRIRDNKEFISSKNYIVDEATKTNLLRLITVNNRVISNFLIK